jgi:hypothetical protein
MGIGEPWPDAECQCGRQVSPANAAPAPTPHAARPSRQTLMGDTAGFGCGLISR